MIFSIFFIFLHPQIPDFQIVVSLSNIVLSLQNHTSMEILFIVLSDDVSPIIYLNKKKLLMAITINIL